MLKVIELDHIVLNVGDVERSVDFYTRILGLSGERLDEYRAGSIGFPSVRINADTLIDIMKGADGVSASQQRNLNHFCLVTEPTDLEALVATLEREGVTITQRPVSRWGAHGRATSIYFLDPDGNEIEVRYY